MYFCFRYLKSVCDSRNLKVNVKIDISDGPLNQYKNKDAFGHDQGMARQYGWDVLHSFSVTGWGKAKVDLYGAKVPYLIRTILVPILKTKAMQLNEVCDLGNKLCGKPLKKDVDSRFELRCWIHVPSSENVEAHANRPKWKPLNTKETLVNFILVLIIHVLQ